MRPTTDWLITRLDHSNWRIRTLSDLAHNLYKQDMSKWCSFCSFYTVVGNYCKKSHFTTFLATKKNCYPKSAILQFWPVFFSNVQIFEFWSQKSGLQFWPFLNPCSQKSQYKSADANFGHFLAWKFNWDVFKVIFYTLCFSWALPVTVYENHPKMSYSNFHDKNDCYWNWTWRFYYWFFHEISMKI